VLEELGPTLVWSYDKVVGFHCQRKVNVIQYDLRPGVTQPLGEIHTGTDRLVLGGMSDFGGQPQCEWRRRTLVEYVVRLGMRLGLHAAKVFDRFGRAPNSRLHRHRREKFRKVFLWRLSSLSIAATPTDKPHAKEGH
jgi:hypothetical protein